MKHVVSRFFSRTILADGILEVEGSIPFGSTEKACEELTSLLSFRIQETYWIWMSPMGQLDPVSSGEPPRTSAGPIHSPRLRDLSAEQWKSGAAAWLGWLFDGLDMHLYILVAAPFVAELLAADEKDPAVRFFGSWIQAAFLIGWRSAAASSASWAIGWGAAAP